MAVLSFWRKTTKSSINLKTSRGRDGAQTWKSKPGTALSVSSGILSAAGLSALSKTGTTQLRVYCTVGDNDDLGYDYIGP